MISGKTTPTSHIIIRHETLKIPHQSNNFLQHKCNYNIHFILNLKLFSQISII